MRTEQKKTTKYFATSGVSGNGRIHLDLPAGVTLGKRFVVRNSLGGGLTGDVFELTDNVRKQNMAGKILATANQEDVSYLKEMAARECLASDTVNNYAHVVKVSDSYECKWEGIYLNIVSMELADGGSLRDWIIERETNASERRRQGVYHLLSLCEGMKALHDAKLFHWDLKPENCLFVKGVLKISDYGHAQMMTPLSSDSAKSAKKVFGTPEYMAPELFGGRGWGKPDHRSDIYCYGVIFHEILHYAAQRPFDGNTETLKEMHQKGDLSKMDGVPEEYRDIVKKCLSKRPQDRFQSAEALRDALKKKLNQQGMGAGVVPLSGQVVGKGSQAPQPVNLESINKEVHAWVQEYLKEEELELELESESFLAQQLHQLCPHDPMTKVAEVKVALKTRIFGRRMHELDLALSRQDFDFALDLIRYAREISPGSPTLIRVEELIEDLIRDRKDAFKTAKNGTRYDQEQARNEIACALQPKVKRYTRYIRDLLAMQD